MSAAAEADGRAGLATYRAPAVNRTRGGVLVHGIPARLHRDYLAVEQASGCRVILAVLEVLSGALLIARLSRLATWPCECRGCRAGSWCTGPVGIRAGVYWLRTAMSQSHVFGASDRGVGARVDNLRAGC